MIARLAVAAIGSAVILAGPVPAQADEAWQPYGGCSEARYYVTSPGADDCREHGWIIRHRIGVTPRGAVLWNTLPRCEAPEVRRSEAHCWVPFHRVAGRQRAYIVDTVSHWVVSTTMIVKAGPRRYDAPTAV